MVPLKADCAADLPARQGCRADSPLERIELDSQKQKPARLQNEGLLAYYLVKSVHRLPSLVVEIIYGLDFGVDLVH